MSSLRQSLGALSGREGGKIKEAKMACPFGCDQACGRAIAAVSPPAASLDGDGNSSSGVPPADAHGG
jgi:hypothetical protein